MIMIYSSTVKRAYLIKIHIAAVARSEFPREKCIASFLFDISRQPQASRFKIAITSLRYVLRTHTLQKVLVGNLAPSFTKAMLVLSPFPFHFDPSKRSMSSALLLCNTEELLCNFVGECGADAAKKV